MYQIMTTYQSLKLLQSRMGRCRLNAPEAQCNEAKEVKETGAGKDFG
jgi:hypothetical protein